MVVRLLTESKKISADRGQRYRHLQTGGQQSGELDLRVNAWYAGLGDDVCVRCVQTVRKNGRKKTVRGAWVARIRRMRRVLANGSFVEYTKPLTFPWTDGDPTVELHCHWYKQVRGQNLFTFDQVDVDSIRSWDVCGPVDMQFVDSIKQQWKCSTQSYSMVVTSATKAASW